MSIFHLTVRSVSRASGRSAVAAAAYRAGERLTNTRDGRIHDYTGKPVIEAFILAPAGSPAWSLDRSQLWNSAEQAEKRKDAKVAREYELALPADLQATERRDLAEAFALQLVSRYGVAVDVAIHPPDAEGDQRNHHAHLLTTTREIGPDGLGAKTRVLDVSTSASAEVETLRESWATLVNAALAQAKVPDRVDHRSFSRQGKTIEPTVKLGPIVSAIERRARAKAGPGEHTTPVTDRGRFNSMIREMRTLSAYIEKGLAFIAAERRRIAGATSALFRGAGGLSPLTALRRAARQVELERPEKDRERALERQRSAERGFER
jgi:hypothetical protein